MKKKYVLPALISLALTSSWTLADEEATTSETTPSPQATPSPSKTQSSYQELMEKHQAHRDYMREQMEKLRKTEDPDERQRLREEMQQQQEKMRQEMWESDMRPGWGGPGGWGGPNWGGPGPGWGGPRWGGPGPGWGGPRWGGPGWGGSNWNSPNYPENGPFQGRRGGMPSGFDSRRFGGHQAQVEQRLENIEKILKQIAETLAKKNP